MFFGKPNQDLEKFADLLIKGVVALFKERGDLSFTKTPEKLISVAPMIISTGAADSDRAQLEMCANAIVPVRTGVAVAADVPGGSIPVCRSGPSIRLKDP